MTQHHDGPPVIEIVKNGYVRLFNEDGDPIDLPADYALAVAEEIEGRRTDIESAMATDRWLTAAQGALSIVRTLNLQSPRLDVTPVYGGARVVLTVDTEDELYRVATEMCTPISAEPRYHHSVGVDYDRYVSLCAHVGDVKVTYDIVDVELGEVLHAEPVSA